MKLPRAEIRKARIEIIPMIDTIFFLLVFFMMASLSMVQMTSHRVRLPQSATAHTRPAAKVVVSVTREGSYYVDSQQVSEAQVLPLIAARVKAQPDIQVVLNCDRDQQVGRLMRVFDLVKQANVGTVLIATTPAAPLAGKR